MVGRGLGLHHGRYAVLASAPVGIAAKQVLGSDHQVLGNQSGISRLIRFDIGERPVLPILPGGAEAISENGHGFQSSVEGPGEICASP